MNQKSSKSRNWNTLIGLKIPFYPIIIITACTCILFGTATFSFSQSSPDLSGNWSGDWGTVTLKRIGPISYTGTYSDTYGKDTGKITFSLVDEKYEGKWWEGTFRLGTITLQASEDGRLLTGIWSACPSSTIKPGEPKQATLKWIKK